jgi:hypothetical protein
MEAAENVDYDNRTELRATGLGRVGIECGSGDGRSLFAVVGVPAGLLSHGSCARCEAGSEGDFLA